MNEIMINGRFLSQPVTGVQRLAIELVKTFDKMIDCGAIDRNLFSLTLLTERGLRTKPRFNYIDMVSIGKRSGHIWEQIELPRYVRDKVLVNLCGPAPIVKRNQIAIVHDAVPYACPSEFSWIFHMWYRVMFKALCNRTDGLLTVSNFSKKELSRYCGVKKDRFSIAHPGIDHFMSISSDKTILESNDLLGKKYVLAVSSLSPRKNFPRLIEAILLLKDNDLRLVIVGGINNRVFSEIDIKLDSRISYVGRVSDEELKALYKNACCFVFPSLYEGFGIPPLEAMACGCPVIAAKTSSIPEVCGDAVLYCDPNDIDDIANKINNLCADEHLRKLLSLKGAERSSSFTWDSCGRMVWSVIERMFNERGRGDELLFASAI